MKIIKAIWKGNEVPTHEYVLWLKREDDLFKLYVYGQNGWEVLSSNNFDPSDFYTKEQIDELISNFVDTETLENNYYTKEDTDDKYLPLTAGENKPLSGTLYSRAIRPVNGAPALGSKSENAKYIPYIYPARTIYDYGRWGVKRVISYAGSVDPLTQEPIPTIGILDFTVPKTISIKYRITISGGYITARLVEIQVYIFNNQGTTFHSCAVTQNGTEVFPVQILGTSDNKVHLCLGTTSTEYAPMTNVEVEVITTGGTYGTENDIDGIYNTLNPTIVTDSSIYTAQYYPTVEPI